MFDMSCTDDDWHSIEYYIVIITTLPCIVYDIVSLFVCMLGMTSYEILIYYVISVISLAIDALH